MRGLFLMLLFVVSDASTMSYRVHLSSAWYPSKKKELVGALKQHHANATQYYGTNLNSSKIKAIVCPHAGYEYSGDIAASAFKLIKPGSFKRVMILAPSHYAQFEGVALPSEQYVMYKNVLGTMALDTNTLNKLSQQPSLFSHNGKAHEQEHAVNVLLPFIQKYCGAECKLIPLLVGQISPNQALTIASILQIFLDDETLLIVSSDLTHYGQRFNYEPFSKDITQQIFSLDSAIVQQIQNYSLRGFYNVLQKTGATVCGRYPLMVLLGLLEKRSFGDVDSYVVGYDTSASKEENPEHSVSYLSLVISSEQKEELDIHDRLTQYEKGLLLDVAKQSVQDAVHDAVHVPHGSHGKGRDYVPGLLTKSLRETQGSFVTLHEMSGGGKQLRGCIGTIDGNDNPLHENVAHMARSAALHDSRFAPVQPHELPNIQTTVSALTPKKTVNSYHDIELGRDGIVLSRDGRSAVYLPKVPLEQGWNKEQALSSLSQKAGLHKDAWRDPSTKFETFQSIDFPHPEHPVAPMQ